MVGILYLTFRYLKGNNSDKNKRHLIVILEGILLIAHDSALFLLWIGI